MVFLIRGQKRRYWAARLFFEHHSDFSGSWRWPNFDPQEFSCNHCGEFYYDPASFDAIQLVRDLLLRPVRLNSAHRCAIHNARVGGAPLSQHKKMAFDIDITSFADRRDVLTACRQAGFTTFGFYQTFLHTDIRPRRIWYSGHVSRQLWK